MKPDPHIDSGTRYLQNNPVILNWYPKVQAMAAPGIAGNDVEAAANSTHLRSSHIAFLDIDRLYTDLEAFKAERNWYNLNITRTGIRELLLDMSWYRLLIPEHELVPDSFRKVESWYQIALALLKHYMKRYYTFRKRDWEKPHLEYQELSDNDPNICLAGQDSASAGYRLLIRESQDEIIARLTALKQAIENRNMQPWEFRGIKTLWFDRHLYQPLLYMDSGIVEISPVPLNKGEFRFVEDLKTFYDNHSDYFTGRELYLLRNLSKGKGVGFFEEGNFHPDFILWLYTAQRQHIVFVDPKGIRQVGASDPKIRFHKTIKEIEKQLGDSSVSLESFIISVTSAHEIEHLWETTKDKLTAQHILFQQEDSETYIRTMLDMVNDKSK
jgi:hypothetical protein